MRSSPTWHHRLLSKIEGLLGLLLRALDDQLVVIGDHELGVEVGEVRVRPTYKLLLYPSTTSTRLFTLLLTINERTSTTLT